MGIEEVWLCIEDFGCCYTQKRYARACMHVQQRKSIFLTYKKKSL